MDTVSMLEEAINYVKFLKTQIWIQTCLSLMDHDPYSNNLYLPPNATDSLPQQPSYFDANFVAAGMQQPSVSSLQVAGFFLPR